MTKTTQPDDSSDAADGWRDILTDMLRDFTLAEITEVVNAAIVVKTRRQEAA